MYPLIVSLYLVHLVILAVYNFAICEIICLARK